MLRPSLPALFFTVYHVLQRRDDPYHYNPSLVGNAFFLFAFLVCTVSHCVEMIRHRCWYFTALIFGAILEVIGYGARIDGRHNPDSLSVYVGQALFLLVSPACFAATIYMTLGRIIRVLGCEFASPIRSTRITKIFVVGDLLSFFLQGRRGGGGFMGTNTPSLRKIGQIIILIGLFIQIIFFGTFVIVSTIVHRRINKGPSQRALEVNWRKHMKVLYIVSMLIFMRSIFRVVEFVQGFDDWLISHEWTLFVFVGSPMVLVLVVLYLKHPSSLLMKRDVGSAVSLSERAQSAQ